jgi:hypothetical protein
MFWTADLFLACFFRLVPTPIFPPADLPLGIQKVPVTHRFVRKPAGLANLALSPGEARANPKVSSVHG